MNRIYGRNLWKVTESVRIIVKIAVYIQIKNDSAFIDGTVSFTVG